ncbi:MAG TPA: P-II family nitrogen regulator [Spirochaetota bacterium]|nr:P-II family nitrogen regulator [Spirochaetota bacterium]HOF14000.1 P-II family nitrogen regulator [Spirochaetota bacterium]HRR59981.1 P-II family nitrogen regulator [Spirochaetota bacterium]
MKLIIAIIRPEKLADVKKELNEASINLMTVINSIGSGRQMGYPETYRGVKHEIRLLKKIELQIAVNDDYVEPTIKAITRGAKTGNIGDGKIFVIPIEECIRIRTDERGSRAIG